MKRENKATLTQRACDVESDKLRTARRDIARPGFNVHTQTRVQVGIHTCTHSKKQTPNHNLSEKIKAVVLSSMSTLNPASRSASTPALSDGHRNQACTHTHTHTYIHTYIYIHTHTDHTHTENQAYAWAQWKKSGLGITYTQQTQNTKTQKKSM